MAQRPLFDSHDGYPPKPVSDLFSSALGVDVRSLFVRLELAELAISRTWPRPEEQPSGLLGLLCPTTPLLGKTDALYAHHVDELLKRVLAKQDTRLGTDAEVLAALLDASLKAPLNRDGSDLAHLLFARVFPSRFKEADEAQWPAHLDEPLHRAQRLLRVVTRVL